MCRDIPIIRQKLVDLVKKWDAQRKSAAGQMEDYFDQESEKWAYYWDGITVGLTDASHDIEELIEALEET